MFDTRGMDTFSHTTGRTEENILPEEAYANCVERLGPVTLEPDEAGEDYRLRVWRRRERAQLIAACKESTSSN